MHVNQPELLPVDRLRQNPANPKKPLARRFQKGLRASLERWGFAGLLVVAANADGTYDVLDGNTRLEELEKQGVEEIPCIVFQGMNAEERKAFILSHDRNRKVFDEDQVLRQLEELAAAGQDLKALATLTAQDNLERLLAESLAGSQSAGKLPNTKVSAPPASMSSLVLYGPAEEVEGIKKLLQQVKGRISLAAKAQRALRQAHDFLAWEDEKVLAVLLAVVARFAEGKG